MLSTLITAPCPPSGLTYHPEIITPDESNRLVEHLQQLAFISHSMRGQMTKRKMHCFGWNYETQRHTLVPTSEPIPEWLFFLRDRCAAVADVSPYDLQQAIVTLYGQRDAGIGLHVDAPAFGPVILGVSLLSAVEMVFEREPFKYTLTLEPRSLYVMKDEARDQWKHAISKTPRPPRLSVVFRSVR